MTNQLNTEVSSEEAKRIGNRCEFWRLVLSMALSVHALLQWIGIIVLTITVKPGVIALVLEVTALWFIIFKLLDYCFTWSRKIPKSFYPEDGRPSRWFERIAQRTWEHADRWTRNGTILTIIVLIWSNVSNLRLSFQNALAFSTVGLRCAVPVLIAPIWVAVLVLANRKVDMTI